MSKLIFSGRGSVDQATHNHAWQSEIGRWHRRMFPKATPDDILHKLTEEVGELCREWQRGKWGIGAVKTVAASAEADAIGDILIVLAAYCDRRGIQMHDAAALTWADVSQRTAERVHNGTA